MDKECAWGNLEGAAGGGDRGDGTAETEGRRVGGGMRVVELLMEGEKRWDEAKVRDIFTDREAVAILATPIAEHGCVDELTWRFEDKGHYSVKTAYLLQMGFFEGENHMVDRRRKFWSDMVWRLSVPPKVRVFAWRAFSDLIPTSVNLRNHHVPTDGICSFCHDRWCTTTHALLFCPVVIRIWKVSRLWANLRRAKALRLVEIGEMVRAELGMEAYELWIVMLWRVWTAVCRATHDKEELMPVEIEAESVALWEAFQAAKPHLLPESSLGVPLGKKCWCRPRKDFYRVDVDASFDLGESFLE